MSTATDLPTGAVDAEGDGLEAIVRPGNGEDVEAEVEERADGTRGLGEAAGALDGKCLPEQRRSSRAMSSGSEDAEMNSGSQAYRTAMELETRIFSVPTTEESDSPAMDAIMALISDVVSTLRQGVTPAIESNVDGVLTKIGAEVSKREALGDGSLNPQERALMQRRVDLDLIALGRALEDALEIKSDERSKLLDESMVDTFYCKKLSCSECGGDSIDRKQEGGEPAEEASQYAVVESSGERTSLKGEESSAAGLVRRARALDKLTHDAMRRRSQRGGNMVSYDELEMGKVIGSGGFGSVNAARFRGQDVAVKTLNVRTGEPLSLDVMVQISAELARWRRLDHPNVVRLLGSCMDVNDGRACFVMELCDMSLDRLLYGSGKGEGQELTVDYDFVSQIAVGVASGLAYLHKQGIAHCDVKPQNILVNRSRSTGAVEQVKLCDFGLSTYTVSKASTTSIIDHNPGGSPAYMAPEQCATPARLSTKSDIYAVGVVLCELITRTKPWANERQLNILHNTLHGGRPSLTDVLPTIPTWVKNLVQACWSQERAARPTARHVRDSFLRKCWPLKHDAERIGANEPFDISMFTGLGNSKESSGPEAEEALLNTSVAREPDQPQAPENASFDDVGVADGASSSEIDIGAALAGSVSVQVAQSKSFLPSADSLGNGEAGGPEDGPEDGQQDHVEIKVETGDSSGPGNAPLCVSPCGCAFSRSMVILICFAVVAVLAGAAVAALMLSSGQSDTEGAQTPPTPSTPPPTIPQGICRLVGVQLSLDFCAITTEVEPSLAEWVCVDGCCALHATASSGIRLEFPLLECGNPARASEAFPNCQDQLVAQIEAAEGEANAQFNVADALLALAQVCPSGTVLTSEPTSAPTKSVAPTLQPTSAPTRSPTRSPTATATVRPTLGLSLNPTTAPSTSPTVTRTLSPTLAPSVSPTPAPSVRTTLAPSVSPTLAPSVRATLAPSPGPTVSPSPGPTAAPSPSPTVSPSPGPTAAPSPSPTVSPSPGPTAAPSPSPTAGAIVTLSPTGTNVV